jgi:hypothetical protein
MTTPRQDHTCTRGNPFQPTVLDLTLPFTTIKCPVRKLLANGEPDMTPEGLVAEVSLVANAQGVIVPVDAQAIDITIKGSVTDGWTDREYAYTVRGVYTADGEPYDFVSGRILMLWSAKPAA